MHSTALSPLQLHTPVAIFIFNRPDTTRRVFAAIRDARPTKLLVIADGPRPKRSKEVEACRATRTILSGVDWPCEVLTNYAETNLGCRVRVSSGLDWVFRTVEEAIILEDDCLPHPTFFSYCAELLDRYRHNERVMHIGGANFQFGQRYGPASYYFSRYAHVWGWASWRRAWKHYDVGMACWPKVRQQIVASFESQDERNFWLTTWDKIYQGRINTWDYQWAFTCIAQGGLTVIPNVNLISNIGFGSTATHTTSNSFLANIPTEALESPIIHPPVIVRAAEADARVQRLFFYTDSLLRRIVRRLVGVRS